MKTISFLFAFALLPLAASASTIVGNPTVGIVLTQGNDVHVQRIDATLCGTSSPQVHTIATTLDYLDDVDVQLDEDEYCALTAHIQWSPGGPVDAVSVTGFTDLDLDAAYGDLTIELDAGAQSAVLVD